MNQPITYLALPYTAFPDLSFAIANELTAELMFSGKVVFSPVSHSHHVADYLPKDLRCSNSFWMKQDLSILYFCSELLVVRIGEYGDKLIEQSKGCQGEIEYAKKIGIPVNFIDYDYEWKQKIARCRTWPSRKGYCG